MPGGPGSSHPQLLGREQGQQFSCSQGPWLGHKWREELPAPNPICGSLADLGWEAVFVIPALLPPLPWQGMLEAPFALGLKL